MKVHSVSQTLRQVMIFFWDLVGSTPSDGIEQRATAHPRQDCESFSHVAQPVPTCGKHVVAELAFSSPKETLNTCAAKQGGVCEI